jgi:hypothetical protein
MYLPACGRIALELRDQAATRSPPLGSPVLQALGQRTIILVATGYGLIGLLPRCASKTLPPGGHLPMFRP